MTEKKDYRKLLFILSESAAKSFEHMSDEELLKEAVEEGSDPAEARDQLQAIFRNAEKKERQKAFAEAQKLYETRKMEIQQKVHIVPKTREDKRRLFDLAMAKMPELGLAFTAQYRDLKKLTDEDVDSFLKQMEQLGVLQNLLKKKDNS